MQAAHDNLRLASERLMPMDWQPMLNDPQMCEVWQKAAEQLASDLASQSSQPASESSSPSTTCLVVGGLAVQALHLAQHLQKAVVSKAGDAGSGDAKTSDASRVIFSESNQLTHMLASQLVALNKDDLGLTDGSVDILPEQKAGLGSSGKSLDGLVAVNVCSAKLPFTALLEQLVKVRYFSLAH